LYTSPDRGATWTERQPAGDVDKNWFCCFVNGAYMIAGVNGGRIYTSSDYGVTWTERQPAGDVDKNWRGTSIDGAYMIAARIGRLYTSSNYGVTWTERQPAGDVNKNWISCFVNGAYMIAGIEPGRLYTSADYGVSWTERQPAGDTNKNWRSCSISGSYMVAGVTISGLYVSSDYGANWTDKQPVSGSWYSCFINGAYVIAGIYNGRLYTSSDYGINWTEEQPAGDINKFWYSCSISGNYMIAGASSDRLYLLTILVPVITTLAPNLVEDGIANLRLNLEDMSGLTIDSVGYYCDENATPSTEYIETGWRAEIETGIYNIYIKTLPAGETTLYVQAWADDSDGNRYTGSILSFDIPSEPEYTELPDIIFPELPDIPAIEIDLPNINYNIGLDLYLDRTYTRKDLEELRRKCINYEKNYIDFCLILNHNTLLVKNFLQSAYNNGVLGGENEMFTKIYPSQQLTPLYLEPLEPNDFKGIINRFINNNTSNSMGLNHNFDLFTEWLNDYNYTSDGYKASYITPREEIITNNEPTVKYLTSKINKLQREVSMASREIKHNFDLMKEIIQ
ncbi:hypothetical protein LCGC14_2327910, partial [marine sediment metagenome]